MMKVQIGVPMERLQMIKTEKDEKFRFRKVVLVKEHLFGRKMTAVDVTDGEEPERIVAMKIYIEEDGQYREIDVDNITCRSLKKRIFHFGAKEAS